jgi:hypothetical protein
MLDAASCRPSLLKEEGPASHNKGQTAQEKLAPGTNPDGEGVPLYGQELSMTEVSAIQSASIPLDRDVFTRTLIRELAGVLQDVIGLDDASGFISVVGQRMGGQINDGYKSALRVEKLDRQQVAQVLVDLKRRIQGDFFVVEENEERIVLGNRACPFADKVLGRPAMCMMTSNVFGSIAAENLGYAKVVLEETIAQGASGCRVAVYLKPTEKAQQASGREYLGG